MDMANTSNNRKPLVVGIVAAVAVLAAVLALLLTQCVGGQTQNPTETTTAPVIREEGYDLYWNLDRAEYDGKSEAGMSSRKTGSDGFFHVRFFKDGQIVELKVADRKVINAIDVTDLMGLQFDENGIVTGIVRVEQMPVERVGWKFYVQSIGGNLVKLNSSKRLDGLEILLEVEDYTAIYDMTGLEGEVGRKVKMPAELDRVIAIADLQGRLTHVFVTDRSEFMFTVEAECQHCKETVSWKKYTKTDEFPSMPGHYILQNDIRFKGSQVQLPEDSSICVDLNGKTVSKTDGGRMIALFNPGAKFALMDSSEEQTGTILVTGESAQGVGIWLRYGEFHFYGGTIDATAANTRSGGAAVALDANTFMYMHGGTIRGGNAKTEYNEETNSYSRGMGGAVLVAGKFVMNDGLIEGGKAIPLPGYNAKGQLVNNRGYGGNLLARGNAVVELNGGIIRDGYAGTAGGNLYIDGSAELLLNGTQILGGYVDGRGANGGSIYVGSKASVTMTGGSVTGGYCYNEGGNIYCGGTFNMQGGYIGGGTVYDINTGKVKDQCASRNLFLVSGTLNHYAGTIAGGVHAIDASSTRACTVVLAGSPVIDGGKDCKTNLTLNTAGDGVQVHVAGLTDYARIGVGSVGIFTEKTDKANADNFFSDLGADVIHYQERLAVGRMGCVCGSGDHYGDCDGTQLLFVPHNKNNTLPLTTGNWYLTQDIQLAGQQSIRGEQEIVLDLNGHTVTTADGARAYALFDPEAPITLTLTDSSKEKTGAIKAVGKDVQSEGQCIWIRTAGQTVNLYDVTLDASQAVTAKRGAAVYTNKGTRFNMYAGSIVGGTAQAWYKEDAKAVVNGMGGNVYTDGIFFMYGGSITGGKALSGKDDKDAYLGGTGGNLAAGANAEVVLFGGTISGGVADTAGGNIYINGAKAVSLSGVAVSGGVSGNEERKISGSGGNICSTGYVVLEAGSVTGGKTNGNGGNIHLTAAASGSVSGGIVSGGVAARGGNISGFGKLGIYGGTINGGTAEAGGNVFVYGAKAQAALHGGSLENGVASSTGGNVYVGADGAAAELKSITVIGGSAAVGGNLAMAQNSSVVLDTGLIGGTASDRGGNLYQGGGQLALVSGTVKDGKAPTGGNVYLDSSATLTQRGGEISGGTATSNGGNLFAAGGSTYILVSGAVADGVITRDGAANVDMRGTFTMEGGVISGGSRVDANGQSVTLSDAKINLFAYKAKVNISGGHIAGGFMAHTADTRLNIIGDARIDPVDGKPGLTLNAGAVMDGCSLSQNGCVVVSNGADTCVSLGANKTGIFSDQGLVVSLEADNKTYLRKHTHCSLCTGLDGAHEADCQGVDEPRKLWDGGDITENGTYCVHGQLDMDKAASVTASDVTILLEGTVSSTRQAMWIQAGAKVTLKGDGTLEATGVDNETTGVVGVMGELVIDGPRLRQVESTNNVKSGGVVRVAGGKVTMLGGRILNGKAVNGGNVEVSSGEFIMYGGAIADGQAVNGGNIFVSGGKFVMAEDGDEDSNPEVSSGYATGKNGGNAYVAAGAEFTMECGHVYGGYQSGGDGVGNFYVQGTLNAKDGSIFEGYRVDESGNTLEASLEKRNIFVVNGNLNLSGCTVMGGVMIHDTKPDDGKDATVRLSQFAYICSGSMEEPSLTLNNGAKLAIDGKLDDNSVVMLSNGPDTCLGEGSEKGGLYSDKELILSAESDGKLYLRKHVHCLTCGHIDGSHEPDCQGFTEARMLWDGGDITENGTYCLHDDTYISKPAVISAADVTVIMDDDLISSQRALEIREGAKLTLQGSGDIEGMGIHNENTGVVTVNGELVIDGVCIRLIESDSITVNNGGVLTVGSTGVATLKLGNIENGKAANGGGNVFVTGGKFVMDGGNLVAGEAKVGGNVFLYDGGTFEHKSGVITGGLATGSGAQGGNVSISSGTFTLSGGTVQDGRITVDGAGNIDVRSAGKLIVTDGQITGGARINAQGQHVASSDVKCNVFSVNGKLEVSGGYIDGGLMSYGASTQLKLSKDARIISRDSKPSLTLAADALLTVEGKLSENAYVVLSNEADTRIAAAGDKTGLASDKQLTVTAEAGGMYLRAQGVHAHCLCGRTDGTHAEGCDGYDIIFSPTTSFPTTPGNYYVSPDDGISTGAVQLGKSDGTGAVNVVLCLHGKTITTPESNTARVALIWKNSSLTITDCGNGTIKPNAKTVGNGSIFHPAAGSTLTVYNGTLDASHLSTVKNGPAIDNAGTTYIRGGYILGGFTTQAGGAINNTGTLVISGGTVSGGRSGYRGGNIYSNGGNLTISGGSVLDGWVCADSSNIDVRNGSLTISGGTISGGNRYTDNTFSEVNDGGKVKRNIFSVNASVTISGGEIDGGFQPYTTGSGFLKLSGAPKIVSADGKNSLSTNYVMTIAKPGMDKKAQIVVSSVPAGAFAVAESGLTLTSEMAACFTNDSGVKAALENNQLLFK